MTSLGDRITAAAESLAAVSETPRLDAELLMAHVLSIGRSKLLAQLNESVEAPLFDGAVARRLAHEPIAYITNHWEFYSLNFLVESPYLVPRPETEHLVEAVLGHVSDSPARVLEIGTGTGCVALAIALNAPECEVIATDINPDAVEMAQLNSAIHATNPPELMRKSEFTRDDLVEALTSAVCAAKWDVEIPHPVKIDFRQGDLFEPITGDDEPFDVICSNPPYVEAGAWNDLPPVIRLYEDERALLAGNDGLDVIRRLAFEATAYLKPGGMLAFEIGMGQYDSVRDILLRNNYMELGVVHDLAGIPRIALARKLQTRGG